MGKREVNKFISSAYPNFKMNIDHLETPKFIYEDNVLERKEIKPPFPKFSIYKPPQKKPNLATLESITKINFKDQFNKKFLMPPSTSKLQFKRNNFLNKSMSKDPLNRPFYNSRENSLSFQEVQMQKHSNTNFREDSQRSRRSQNSRFNENLLSSMRPKIFHSTFNPRLSNLNFSNPNSRRYETFKPVSKLNLSFNEKQPKLDVIESSELASKVSHMSFGSKLNLKLGIIPDNKINQNDLNQSEKLNKVEPKKKNEREKLEEIVKEFEKDLENDVDISEEEGKVLTLLLKFLFDFDISEKDFLELNDEYRATFRKFVVDRYFKDETERDSQVKLLYHDILVNLDKPRMQQISLEDLVQVENVRGKVRKDHAVTSQVKCITVRVKKFRKNIIDSIHPDFLTDFSKDEGSKELECSTIQMTKSFLINESPKIIILQDYLRKRERLNLICRRRKKMHKKSKRNDEKIKKIFKRIMKSLMRKYRKKYLSETFSELNSTERERAFYTYYFGDLDDDIRKFYDPLKRKLDNPKFKSISTKYLTFLARSSLFVKDLREYCTSEMVLEVLEKYPEQILKRFKENPNFLLEMDKFKTKFEWIKHELQAAIYHFMSIFKICLLQASNKLN